MVRQSHFGHPRVENESGRGAFAFNRSRNNGVAAVHAAIFANDRLLSFFMLIAPVLEAIILGNEEARKSAVEAPGPSLADA